MRKHTKGPWRYDKDFNAVFIIKDQHIKAVADFGKVDLPEREANAQLIATSPELLDALKGMIAWTEATAMYHLKDTDFLPRGFDKWKSLINKAEGRD